MKTAANGFDLEKVLRLARDAGLLAKKYYGNAGASRKADSTFVTEADREVERLVRERLGSLTPGWCVIGEEQEGRETAAAERTPCWVVDPVDGTSAFVAGVPTWTFSLGLVEDGRAVWGTVYVPMLDELYYTHPGGGVMCNNTRVRAEQPVTLDSEAVLYVTSDAHRLFDISFPGKLRSLGSAAYHGLLTARPTTAGVLQGTVYLWDAAAVLAINREWGIRAATLEGEEIDASWWGEREKIKAQTMFAHPDVFERVAATLRFREE